MRLRAASLERSAFLDIVSHIYVLLRYVRHLVTCQCICAESGSRPLFSAIQSTGECLSAPLWRRLWTREFTRPRIGLSPTHSTGSSLYLDHNELVSFTSIMITSAYNNRLMTDEYNLSHVITSKTMYVSNKACFVL